MPPAHCSTTLIIVIIVISNQTEESMIGHWKYSSAQLDKGLEP